MYGLGDLCSILKADEQAIQLHDGGFRRQDSEAVLSHDQSQTTAIVPLHMKLPDIIDAFQRTRGTGRHRVICRPRHNGGQTTQLLHGSESMTGP